MPFWLLAFFLFTSPALSGIVTCAGKTYKDVVYAKFTTSEYGENIAKAEGIELIRIDRRRLAETCAAVHDLKPLSRC